MIDNNTEQQIIQIMNDELSNYDYSSIESEEELNTIINAFDDSNILELLLGAFGCSDEDSKHITELFKTVMLNKYKEYRNNLKHDNGDCDECTCDAESSDKTENTIKQNYCEYICNNICDNAADAHYGYTPNTTNLSTKTIDKLHNITRGYFINSFMYTKDDYIFNATIDQLRGLYDTLFDFAGHIYNK